MSGPWVDITSGEPTLGDLALNLQGLAADIEDFVNVRRLLVVLGEL